MAFYTDVNSYSPKDNPLLRDIETLYQSIYNILNTRRGERLFNPEFGVDLYDELFELVDDENALEMFRIITEAVERYEPRVAIDYAQTKVEPDLTNYRYDLELWFEGINLPSNDNIFRLTGSLTK